MTDEDDFSDDDDQFLWTGLVAALALCADNLLTTGFTL